MHPKHLIPKWLIAFILFLFPFLASAQEKGLDDKINEFIQPASDFVSDVVFYPILISGVEIPIVILVLLGGAIFFTFYFRFVNIKDFFLSIKVTRGTFDEIDSKAKEVHTDDYLIGTEEGDILKTEKIEKHIGEVSHFQALTAALSATVGLGNIAGVAIAIVLGGPGATLWMIIAGLFGMTTKFVECTLGVKYRDIEEDGTVHGGPMYYLKKGLANKGWARLGKILAIFFALMTVGGSFGGGNMFQANQAAEQLIGIMGWDVGYAGFTMGLIMAFLVALVIIGGIKRIGSVTSRVVPIMATIYVGAALLILFMKFEEVGGAFQLIWTSAFNPTAVAGGFVGVLVVGIQRAVFSNEAGVGSAAIAHSAVKTRFPVSEGLVAMIGPFVDTVVICTMTALVIIITGNSSAELADTSVSTGVSLTSQSFNAVIPHFEYILTIAVVLFAYSSMISWSYYGLQSWKFIFGKNRTADLSYKILFLIFVVVGSSVSLGAVVDFSDAMIFAMVLPNMIGLIILTPEVRKEYNRYIKAIKNYYAQQRGE